jgi:hypothetical protein
MFGFLISALVVPAAIASAQGATGSGRRSPEEILLGTCGTGSAQVDLTRVAFLENRSFDQEGPNGPVRVILTRESVAIENIGSGSDHTTVVHDIGLAVARDGDIDIDLKLAFLDRRLVVFWRETVQHRSYRQGLFAVAPPSLVPICEGRGGVDVSH